MNFLKKIFIKKKDYEVKKLTVTINSLDFSTDSDSIQKMKEKYEKDNYIISLQANLNMEGIEFEKRGELEKAINNYEENIKQNFEGNHPYDRLAIIYRKRKDYENEIRILKHAVHVFENIVNVKRGDRIPKLNKFKERLIKAEQLKNKNSL